VPDESLRAGRLRAGDRAAVARLLAETGVFRPAEIDVALELVDEGVAAQRAGGAASDAAGDADGGMNVTDYEYELTAARTADGALAGYACWGPTPGTDRTWDLYWLAADPALRGRGVGAFLLEEVERRLRAARARLVVVETPSRPEYDPARRRYGASGYAEAARLRDYYAPGDDRIIFTKRLGARGEERLRDE
jgi:ribosomal protein S18 acetylase RimI-like enzyme